MEEVEQKSFKKVWIILGSIVFIILLLILTYNLYHSSSLKKFVYDVDKAHLAEAYCLSFCPLELKENIGSENSSRLLIPNDCSDSCFKQTNYLYPSEEKLTNEEAKITLNLSAPISIRLTRCTNAFLRKGEVALSTELEFKECFENLLNDYSSREYPKFKPEL